MNVALQEAGKRHFGHEVRRRLLAQFSSAMDAAYGVPRGATVPRPETVAKWHELPEKWEDNGDVKASDIRKYQIARKKCVESAQHLDEIKLELAHLQNLAQWLDPIVAACNSKSVQELADELRQCVDVGEFFFFFCIAGLNFKLSNILSYKL